MLLHRLQNNPWIRTKSPQSKFQTWLQNTGSSQSTWWLVEMLIVEPVALFWVSVVVLASVLHGCDVVCAAVLT